jgi:competence protein ComEC
MHLKMVFPNCPRPLVRLLLFVMGGLLAGHCLPRTATFLSVLGGMCLVGLVLAWKRQRGVGPLILCLFFLYGHWSIQRWIAPEFPENHLLRFVDDDSWHLIGVVDAPVERFADSTRFVVTAELLDRGKTSHRVTGRVRVAAWEQAAHIREGDRIACLARLREIRNFNNPGSFDYRQHMGSRKIWVSASVSKKEPLVRIDRANVHWVRRAVMCARQAVSDFMDQAPPGISRGIVRALVTGDRSEIPRETQDLFGRIGIVHILSISGLHIGMVGSMAFFAFRFALARSERLLLAAWATRGAALLSVAPVVSYGLLAASSPATTRAVIMVLVFLLAIASEREPDAMNTLAAAAVVILVVTPAALFDISFQLSFSAVFAILYIREKISLFTYLVAHRSSLLNRVYLFLLISGAATLGTLPITVYYFNQTSLIGLAANCIMVPLVGSAVVVLGLLSVFLLPAWQAAALWMLKMAIYLTDASLVVAEVLDRFPLGSVRVVTPTLLEIGLYYTTAWAILNLRNTKAARIVLVAAVLAGMMDVTYWLNRRFHHRDLRVTFLDVGQGNAALLEVPKGLCMLLDGGGFFDSQFDVGAKVVAPFLWNRKIGRVDILLLSHPHPDHLNGLLFIAENFHVQEIWMTGQETTAPPYRQLKDIIKRKGIKVLGPAELAGPKALGGVRFEVLYPGADFLTEKSDESWRTTNNNSLVLKVTMNAVSFLFPGDVEADAERKLVHSRGRDLASDVLLIPHHGSKTSSTPGFVACVSPRIAVISAGFKNRFKFPHDEVLDRYAARGSQVFRTDLNGAVTIVTDGTGIEVAPYVTNAHDGDIHNKAIH